MSLAGSFAADGIGALTSGTLDTNNGGNFFNYIIQRNLYCTGFQRARNDARERGKIFRLLHHFAKRLRVP